MKNTNVNTVRHTLPLVVVGVFVVAFTAIFLFAPTEADANRETSGNATIIADKIICDDEQYLPNGQVSNPITSTTAADWVAQNSEHCWLADNWNFEWRYGSGAYDETGWNAFSINTPATVLTGNGTIQTREVWDNNYIPFTWSSDNVTAEFYCANDVANYDNWEWIQNVQADTNYYCIGFNVPEPYCGDGEVQEPNHQGQYEECDGEQGCSEQCTWEPATVHAQKVVCEDEADLPNSGTNGLLKPISASTAQGWVDQSNGKCWLTDWDFEWIYDENNFNPGDNTGNSSSYNDFPGNSIELYNLGQNNKIWVREVWNNAYIPFTYGASINSDDVTAELYCHTDVLNYDNWEWVSGLQYGQDYYCVGFNVLEPYCGDGNVDENLREECDGNIQSCVTNNGYTGEQTCFVGNSDPFYSDQQPWCTWNPCVPQENCGDGEKNGPETCDGTDGIEGDQTCSDTCTIIEPVTGPTVFPSPVLSVIKSVDKALANPSDTLTYTVTVSNSGDGEAVNVVLTDTLPAGFTYANDDGTNSGDTEKTWTWDSLAASADVTVKYDVLVDSSAGADTYDNIASVSADKHEAVEAVATTEVKIPVVLGEQTPSLTITKSVDQEFANPGNSVNYTVTVTNDGNAPAMNAVLTDTLPVGFVFAHTGEKTATWKLGDIVPTESVTKTYEVKIDSSILAGKYINTAAVSADEVKPVSAQATLEIRELQVLGAEIDEEAVLPTTGGGLAIVLTGLATLGAGMFLRKKIQ